MALEKASVIISRSRFRLGGTTTATSAQWPDSEMAEHGNDAIKLLQNVEDDNTNRFMVKKKAVTSTGSADYTLSAVPFSLTDVRKIVSVRDDTDDQRYLQASDKQVRDGTKGVWTDIKLYAHTRDTADGHLEFVNAPANTNTITIQYSYFHVLLTSSNLVTQDVEMAESYYPILEALIALIAISKYPAEQNRIQTLHSQLALIPLPGRKRPLTDTETFNARFGALASGGHDTVTPMAGR